MKVFSLTVVLLVFSVSVACLSLRTDAAPGASKKEQTTPSVTIQTETKTVSFQVSLALNDTDRQKGLMFREHLAPDEGMFFIFPQQERLSFWMKNTYLPLDMIFINEAMKIVGIVENAEPMTLESRHVKAKSRYVLEVNAGTCRRHNIRNGDSVTTLGIDFSAAR